MANKRAWTLEQRRLRELERICLEWADHADLILARDGLIALAAGSGAAADAIARSSMPC
ncbi:hypothetical protein JQ631_10850 [Bradyrhizobium manausense]|uniref:hypothetical protein n=1 Tax=Bradyrhizobium manausense TaxID=989370 RepID=UPI001BA4547B|nr:hypothetical protein [Bradyrhizobium manausense]MBR0789567.1 hypothetical protein [Bradyrhizobium manausense]